mmetsp:Transcript_42391/g.106949  ORF Transcript_42391/g.106949 Transcript_42391/m.106949 type:complete len:368 (+) Transcript_42391:269-1372(+)|eukprot:CAMPEP_0177639712 /NCGR_PEP_ID=MMETSP0447-20121125/6164_1 /TAXON_ID=0 /ORGANISM="Stygamoeba regulata, Strain BSH-02190019" /LENGTH=367 /DNA_ID=CAMNT_0019141751 /DNA_START=87 /DNA_END=1190 /DNA_ORIENTATION=-
MGIAEKIAEITAEMNRTQKNKATEHHLGGLKAKLAKLRAQLLEPPKTSGKGGDGFEVEKSGDARVCLIGFPSVGKSTILTKYTKTESATAEYAFTTLTCIPGVIEYNDARIQLLDTPGIIEGAAQGKGRGRQVIAVTRTADVILLMMDATKGNVQRRLIENELEAVGMRLNQEPPNITFKRKKTGGLKINNTVPLTHLSPKTIKNIMNEFKIFNAEVLFRCDATVEQFLDVIQGNCKYVPCIYVYNKIDNISLEEVDEFARMPNSVVVSCQMDLNLDYLLEVIWEKLRLLRIYTKKRGEPPSLDDPVVVRGGSTVKHAIRFIHRDLIDSFKYALVWGTSTKHQPQRVGLTHELQDEDVVQVVTTGKS